MTTNSMILHWILTGIDENNLLYVTTDNIFYPRILPSMTPHSCFIVTVIRPWPFGDTSLLQQFPYSDNSTFIDIGHSFIVTSSYNNGFPSHNASVLSFSFPFLHSVSFALWTSPQYGGRACEWSVIGLSAANKRMEFFVIYLWCFLPTTYVAFKWYLSTIFKPIPFVYWAQTCH